MTAERELQFLNDFQRLLDEGSFVSTYKFALLQALADLSVEREVDGDGRLHVPIGAQQASTTGGRPCLIARAKYYSRIPAVRQR